MTLLLLVSGLLLQVVLASQYYAITIYYKDSSCKSGTHYMSLSMPTDEADCLTHSCKGPNSYGEYTQHTCSPKPAQTFGVVMTEYYDNKCEGSFIYQFSMTKGTCSPSEEGNYQSFTCNGDGSVEGIAECDKGCSSCEHAIALMGDKCYESDNGEYYLHYACGGEKEQEQKELVNTILIDIAVVGASLVLVAATAYFIYKKMHEEPKPGGPTRSSSYKQGNHRQGMSDPLMASSGHDIN
eukprot:gb/GEZN01012652.1/.p1 GENE.gb/GEZN01012652.1/~~gb/GEZN01012652.1/.p1  ORF type:complete len:239 (-),score=17.34 gb/GEZN01012652.1/:294-1010(-)